VKQKEPNDWGLHDLPGHGWEWCADKWNAGDDDPAASRVVRGGGWAGEARYARAACRRDDLPSDRDGHLGFRCASSGAKPAGG